MDVLEDAHGSRAASPKARPSACPSASHKQSPADDLKPIDATYPMSRSEYRQIM
jgi:hypothetical protein